MTSTIAAGITASTAMGLASQALAATPAGGTFRYGVGHGSTTDLDLEL